jgi:hypothetical protein
VTTVLWLGAHKTGTTFLQKSLDLSAEQMRSHGVNYMELDEFRRRYTRPLLYASCSDAPADPGPFVDSDLPVSLIFDENVAGLVQHVVSHNGFYPFADQRARTVVEHLQLHVDTVVLGVRRYDRFVPSVYCEALKSTRFRTFDNYLRRAFKLADEPSPAREPSIDDRRNAYSRLNWFELVRRLGAAFPGAAVHVYFHEHLRGRETLLLEKVLGVPAGDITLLQSPERTGFSARAVDELHAIARSREVQRRDVREMTASYPSGPEYEPFYPWSEADRDLLVELYRTHSDEILADPTIETIALQ